MEVWVARFHDDRSTMAEIFVGRFEAHLVFTKVDLRLGVGLLIVMDLGGKLCLGEREAGSQQQGEHAACSDHGAHD